jgi:hypothetical protein
MRKCGRTTKSTRYGECLDRDVLGDIQYSRYLQSYNARKCLFSTSLPALLKEEPESDTKNINVTIQLNSNPPESQIAVPVPSLDVPDMAAELSSKGEGMQNLPKPSAGLL